MYLVIYDGECNLCTGLVQPLRAIDGDRLFCYAPMQDQATLERYGIAIADCALGMILIDQDNPDRRWQGSAAAEEIARLLPAGAPLVAAYRSLPGLKPLGDLVYEQIRDHRYAWFGRRTCSTGTCAVDQQP